LFLIIPFVVKSQETYVPPQEEMDWALQFSGIRGAGMPVVGFCQTSKMVQYDITAF